LENPHNKIERSVLKIAAWTLGIIIFLIVGGIVGHRSFRKWQERRLVAQGNALVREGDLKRASLDARRILQINPESAEGARIMARIAERANLPTAVELWRRAADSSHDNTSDLLALAKVASRFEDAGNRDYALKRLPESAKNTAEYHSVQADIAKARRDGAAMEQHLREAVRLDPATKEYALRLATLQLSASAPALRDEGRNSLVQLQADPASQREATRVLTDDALRRGDVEAAIKSARELQELPGHDFSDELLLLSALNGGIDPSFTTYLQKLEGEAADDGARAGELITWLNGHKMPAAAITWASQLGETVMGQKAVAIALSDSYIAARDWQGIQRLVKDGKWGPLDFLRNALAALAFRETGNQSDSAAQWSEAVKKVSADTRQAVMLAEIVQKWGWRDEALELFWVATKDPAKGDDALQALYSYYAKNGPSSDLYRVLLRRRELHPDDLNIQNNVAQLSLLLNLNADQGQKLARDLYEKDHSNPAYVSTYGFALYTQGDLKKALSVYRTLTPEQLHQPEIATYYGIVLAAAGEHDQAAEFLALGQKAQLLPEERALLEKANRTIARR
jgi:Flp pilus assembly protein TadD